jgi:hypothetical protein
MERINRFFELFDIEAVKKQIANCPENEVVILLPHYSINAPQSKSDSDEDGDAYYWEWEEFEQKIGCTLSVTDYDDLVADPHGVLDN